MSNMRNRVNRSYNSGELHVARMISKTDDHVILEVIRDKTKKMSVRDGDEFYTVIFTEIDPWGNRSGRDTEPGKN